MERERRQAIPHNEREASTQDRGAGRARGVSLMVLEADETVLASDRRLLAEVTGGSDLTFRYMHKRAHEDPLLWPADLVAWALHK